MYLINKGEIHIPRLGKITFDEAKYICSKFQEGYRLSQKQGMFNTGELKDIVSDWVYNPPRFYDSKNGELQYSYNKIYSVLNEKYGLNYKQTNELIANEKTTKAIKSKNTPTSESDTK
jgi:hypothetical protein